MALIDKLTAIADAIRGKTGKTEEMTLDQMVTEIAAIETGGGGDESVLTSFLDNSIVTLNYDGTRMVEYGVYKRTNLETANLPNCTFLEASAFHGCSSLKNINAPQLVDFRISAFRLCTSLETIYLPSATSCKQAAYAFLGCTSLKNVDIPNLTSVQSGMFEGCTSLELFDASSLCFEVVSGAFKGCTALKTLILRQNTKAVNLLNINAFTSTPFESGGTGGTVYCPQALIESYQTATNWSTLYAAGTCNFVAIEGSEYE